MKAPKQEPEVLRQQIVNADTLAFTIKVGIERPEKKAIALANETIKNVTAYQSFLKKERKKQKISSINTLAELKNLPNTDKTNYLKKYSMKELSFPDAVGKWSTISATSGTSGTPLYVPRLPIHDNHYIRLLELIFFKHFGIKKNQRVLVINGFGMGIWIGGLFTHSCLNQLNKQGYNVTCAPTGIQTNSFVEAFQNLSPFFDVIVLGGYPPHVREFVSEIVRGGLSFDPDSLRILSAAESYSESFRDFVAATLNIRNVYSSFCNMYGSVEFGTMGHETPFSIFIRRQWAKNKSLFSTAFNYLGDEVPSLVQYDPNFIFFEEENNELFATGYGSGYPLIRYRFYDSGGIIPYRKMIQFLNTQKLNYLSEVDPNANIDWPFVFVGSRSNSIVSYHGINIYPEYIFEGLQNSGFYTNCTGRFKMNIRTDENFNQKFGIWIEVKSIATLTTTDKKQLSAAIVDSLLKKSSEFSELYSKKSRDISPEINFVAFESFPFEKKGHKEKWTL